MKPAPRSTDVELLEREPITGGRARAPMPAGEACMAGAVMTTGREVTRQLIGDAAYERALASVPPHIAAEYRRVTSVTWVPLSIIEPVIMAMGQAAGRDPFALQDDVARTTVERSLRSIWRIFLRFTSNDAILSRVPIIFSKSYSRGRLVTGTTRDGRTQVELLDWPNAPMHILRNTRVGLEATFHAAGRPNVHVSLERTPNGALYVVSGLR
ncbi:hypothetical protein A7982_12535 [Minicystis rosea]|nr:hypothetical protein A7982_12535 [Minicystis rosea]